MGMDVSYVVVGGVAVSQQGFPWHISADGICEGWAGRGILRVEMDDAEGVWLLEVFHDDNQGGVATVWGSVSNSLLRYWRQSKQD